MYISLSGIFKHEDVLIAYQNQFEAVDRATPFDRIGSWKISPITTHAAAQALEGECVGMTQ